MRCAIALLALLTGSAQAQAPSALDCTGAFAKDSSHARLEQVFGRENVTFDSIPGPEGSEEKASVVFAKDPKRTVLVSWYDERRRQRPSTIAVYRESLWATANRVRVGMPIAAVEKLNGKAFVLSGFEWDYGGTVVDSKGGVLATPLSGCRLMVRFEPGPNPPARASTAVAGDKRFSSANPNLRAVKPVIYNINLSHRE